MNDLNWPANRVALYIHIPFCKKKCDYCSFVSFTGRDSEIPAYIRSLKAELLKRLEGKEVYSIYFGGGTPSLLQPGQLADIMHCVRSTAPVISEAEITMEANPGTINMEYLEAARQAGINRLSLGVQSFRDEELRLLGRIHSASQSRDAVIQARQAGFKNLSLDLIYGLPGQAVKTWEETVCEAIKMEPEHISVYALTIEDGTPMQRKIESGSLARPDADTAADCYEAAEKLFSAGGYSRYEISNWARPGYECRHNLVYWHCLPYTGAGTAAHSYLNKCRSANTSSLDKYIDVLNQGELPVEMAEDINTGMQLSEFIILQLRLAGGVNLAGVARRFGLDIRERYREEIAAMKAAGLLEEDGGNLKLSTRGVLLGNEVFMRFLP